MLESKKLFIYIYINIYIYILVIEVFDIIFFGCEANVALIVEPNSYRIKICNDYPLSYIHFPIHNNQWIFYVFLNNPL